MTESNTLTRITALEEEVEALRLAFQAILFAEEVEAEVQGCRPLAEGTGSLDFDQHEAETNDRGNLRRRRIIERAQQIILEGRPRSRDDGEGA